MLGEKEEIREEGADPDKVCGVGTPKLRGFPSDSFLCSRRKSNLLSKQGGSEKIRSFQLKV